jgi:hypothetical protein
MTNYIKLKCDTFTPNPKNEPKAKTKPKRIKKVSEKRKIENKEYKTLRLVYLENHKECEVKFKGCEKRSKDIHHKYSGKDRSKYFLDIKTWIPVCRKCHTEIHNDSAKARNLNLLK